MRCRSNGTRGNGRATSPSTASILSEPFGSSTAQYSRRSIPAGIIERPGSGVSARSKAEFMRWSTRGAVPTVGSSVRGRQMAKKPERIVRVTVEEARQTSDVTDVAALDAMTDEDIGKAVAEDPDAAPLDIDWTKARLVLPPGKESVTLRVDRDVLAWFRATGKGFHTRMNAVFRAC